MATPSTPPTPEIVEAINHVVVCCAIALHYLEQVRPDARVYLEDGATPINLVPAMMGVMKIWRDSGAVVWLGDD